VWLLLTVETEVNVVLKSTNDGGLFFLFFAALVGPVQNIFSSPF
jgi:hypothetical protein